MLHKPGAFAIPSDARVDRLSAGATLARAALLAPVLVLWVPPLGLMVAAATVRRAMVRLATR